MAVSGYRLQDLSFGNLARDDAVYSETAGTIVADNIVSSEFASNGAAAMYAPRFVLYECPSNTNSVFVVVAPNPVAVYIGSTGYYLTSTAYPDDAMEFRVPFGITNLVLRSKVGIKTSGIFAFIPTPEYYDQQQNAWIEVPGVIMNNSSVSNSEGSPVKTGYVLFSAIPADTTFRVKLVAEGWPGVSLNTDIVYHMELIANGYAL